MQIYDLALVFHIFYTSNIFFSILSKMFYIIFPCFYIETSSSIKTENANTTFK